MSSFLSQTFAEDPMESEGRKDADFLKMQTELFAKLTKAGVSSFSPTALLKMPGAAIEGLLGFLGNRNPFIRHADASQNLVWILDNTAFRSSDVSTYKAEVVACYFRHGRGDLTAAVAAIADTIGLDGEPGHQAEAKARIAERLKPFIDAVAPARTLPVVINAKDDKPLRYKLGPSDVSGISSQILEVGAHSQQNGDFNEIETDTEAHGVSHHGLPPAKAVTRLYERKGWGVISDIDDTIKITQTPDPVGILRTTFAEPAQYTSHMPDFYKILDEQLEKPAWFYLSASPYNLYQFLRKFITDYYPLGTIILRDASWMTLGGLFSTLTQGTKEYKISRIDKIHGWLPDRKFICIGDSTQMDPETYAACYNRYPGWIQAIYIRKVTDAPFMEKKNTSERFEKAFEGIPSTVWKVFVLPDELKDHLQHVAGEAHLGIMGQLSAYFCGHEREKQQLEKDKVSK